MLSTRRCRELLSAHDHLTDSEVETLRDQLSALAEVLLGALPRRSAVVSADRLEELEERAAILEFDAGFSREAAERRAAKPAPLSPAKANGALS